MLILAMKLGERQFHPQVRCVSQIDSLTGSEIEE